MSTDQVGESARVVDVRYSAYHGERKGRGGALWSLARWSALTALGARRGWKAKVIPGVLIGIAFIPAVALLALRALVGSRIDLNVIPYDQYTIEIGIDVLLFAGLVTPEMLCPDRRDRVLSLYFSTAVTRDEYVGGKLLGTIVPLSVVTTLPVLLLFAGNTIFALHPVGYLQHHWGDVPRIIGSGTLLAVYFSLVGLAIASLTTRRALAMGAYVGGFVLLQAVGGTLVRGIGVSPYFFLIALGRVPILTARAAYGTGKVNTFGVPLQWYLGVTLCVMAASMLVLAWRYRPGVEG